MKLSVLTLTVFLVAGARADVREDMDAKFQSLKEAEAKKDAAQVKKLAAETGALARQLIAAPAPEGGPEKENWTIRVQYANEVMAHAEYALFATALLGPAATTADLMATLEQISPKSKYLDGGYGAYIQALNQSGGSAKVPAIVEKGLANFPENEDLLMMAADSALSRQQNDRALALALRLISAAEKHAKPEGMAAGDWERKKTAALSRGHWIAGCVLTDKTQYFEANRHLRIALPLVKGNQSMYATALFNLGIANYQLGVQMNRKGQVMEAIAFSDQASNLPGPQAMQAARNSYSMKQQAAKMR